MLSIARHMDEYDIATEIKLERKAHKGAFFLLEGSTDIQRFHGFVDQELCSLVNCYGRNKVVRAVDVLYDWGFVGILGAVDADFDRILDTLDAYDDLIYSEAHDFDIDWATDRVVSKYLSQAGDAAKIASVGSIPELIERIMLGLKPVSIARLLNANGKIKYKVSGIDIQKCSSGFETDIEEYISLLLVNENNREEDHGNLHNLIEGALPRQYDLKQLTNGHDFHAALGVCLRGHLGSRRDVHTWGNEVGMHLRLAFDDEEFKRSQMFVRVRQWEEDNPPFIILDGRFRSPLQAE